MIFNLHLGRWRVSPFDFNKPAISFWRNVFEVYTGGNYTTRRRQDNRGHEFVFN